MKKREFIEELQFGLGGRLSKQDIQEVISDYNDVFEQGSADGKDEEQVASELGSPARIAQTILEEDELRKREEVRSGMDPKYWPFADRFASMGSRLTALLVDTALQILLFLFVGLVAFFVPDLIRRTTGFWLYGYMNEFLAAPVVFFMLLFFILCILDVMSAFFIWATNGYTPGKWLLHIRVVKLNGEKISFMEAIMREVVVKSIASSFTTGLLNVFSFIWGCVSDVNKTVHDLVASTTVVYVTRNK